MFQTTDQVINCRYSSAGIWWTCMFPETLRRWCLVDSYSNLWVTDQLKHWSINKPNMQLLAICKPTKYVKQTTLEIFTNQQLDIHEENRDIERAKLELEHVEHFSPNRSNKLKMGP